MHNLRAILLCFLLVTTSCMAEYGVARGEKTNKRKLEKGKQRKVRTMQGYGANPSKNHQPLNPEVTLDDLGVRFSIMMPDHPMGPEDYPLSSAMARFLRTSTQAVSVVLPYDCDECPDNSMKELIESLGGTPTHPSSDPHSPYWHELREVIRVQLYRRIGADPSTLMPMPSIWEGQSIEEVAGNVHNEFPGIHHIKLMKELLAQGATFNRTAVPSPCNVDFLRGVVMLADMNGFAVRCVGSMNFATKWWVGRARPEEVVWMITTGQLTFEDGVPIDIIHDVQNMNLSKASDFTAFPEGCPVHPSWPAMHSAASSASLWLAVVMNLTPEQLCEVRKVDYGIAYARTVAGVHFSTDNIAGLSLGQEVLAHFLPKYLSETYGANKEDVEHRIEEFRFDWNTFLSSDCILRQGN